MAEDIIQRLQQAKNALKGNIQDLNLRITILKLAKMLT
jgi:hypothetical protein